ncbi:MAG: hypothetical protein K0R71_47 [Bacillales bacterium]|nr:hypothetical protein [Bacillales bacterium]
MDILKTNPDVAFIAAPFIVLFILKFILKFLIRGKRKASKLATDISAIFFIMAVYFEIKLFLNFQALWFMLLGLIVIFSILAVSSYIKNYEVSYEKLMRLFLRVCFILFVIGYLGLLVFALYQRVQAV